MTVNRFTFTRLFAVIMPFAAAINLVMYSVFLPANQAGRCLAQEKSSIVDWERKPEHKELEAADPIRKASDAPERNVPERVLKTCPTGLRLIDDCVQHDDISIVLFGDGTSTSHCTLVLKDKKTGATTTVSLQTACISRKTKHPPPTEEVAQRDNITYKLGPAVAPNIVAILQAADELASQGKLDEVPIPLARRQSTVAQLAIWQELGGTAAGDKDAINRDNLKSDMLLKSGISPQGLTKEEDIKLNDKVDLICEAVDLTCKTANQMPKENIPKREVAETGTVPKPSETQVTDDGSRDKPAGVPVPTHNDITEKQPGSEIEESNGGQIGEEICIPALTTFVPEDNDYQTILVLIMTKAKCPSTIRTDTVGMPDEKTEEKKVPPLRFKDPFPTSEEKEKKDPIKEKAKATMYKDQVKWTEAEEKARKLEGEEREKALDKVVDLIYESIEKALKSLQSSYAPPETQNDIMEMYVRSARELLSDDVWKKVYKRARGTKGILKDFKGPEWDSWDKTAGIIPPAPPPTPPGAAPTTPPSQPKDVSKPNP
jgi:hypothetical protein